MTEEQVDGGKAPAARCVVCNGTGRVARPMADDGRLDRVFQPPIAECKACGGRGVS